MITNINDYYIDDEINENKEDVSENNQNIWYNQPQSVSECDIFQIIYITNNVIVDLDKLQPLQQNIIEYIKENQFDGNKLTTISRKEFIKNFVTYFDTKKLTLQFGKLYNGIVKCNINMFLGTYENNQLQ
eukprot:553910_1